MEVKIYDLDKREINYVIAKISRLIKVPSDLEIYFVKGIYEKASKNLPKQMRKDIKLLSRKSSFSYSLKDKHFIFIQLKKREYLLKNKKALIGLLLHEIFHTIQRKKGLDKKLKESYDRFYLSRFSLLKKLDYDKKSLVDLFLSVGKISVLLAKELYTNTEIINKGLSDYLIEYYKEEFTKTRTCPKPVFYEKFKKATKKDINIVRDAFEFEFALLGFILPLKKLKNRRVKSLMNHVHFCYEINIGEIARKCREITFTYEKNFGSKKFQKEFFEGVFFKVYNLLK